MLKNELKSRNVPSLKTREEMLRILQNEVYGYLPTTEFKMQVSEPKVIERRFACGAVTHSRV